MGEVGTPGGKKVTRSLLRKANQVFIFCHLFGLHMCCENMMFHGLKEGQSLRTLCIEHVVCTFSG